MAFRDDRKLRMFTPLKRPKSNNKIQNQMLIFSEKQQPPTKPDQCSKMSITSASSTDNPNSIQTVIPLFLF